MTERQKRLRRNRIILCATPRDPDELMVTEVADAIADARRARAATVGLHVARRRGLGRY